MDAAHVDAPHPLRQQTITVTVPKKPSDAGIDPDLLLIDLERFDNVEEVETEGRGRMAGRLGRNQLGQPISSKRLRACRNPVYLTGGRLNHSAGRLP